MAFYSFPQLLLCVSFVKYYSVFSSFTQDSLIAYLFLMFTSSRSNFFITLSYSSVIFAQEHFINLRHIIIICAVFSHCRERYKTTVSPSSFTPCSLDFSSCFIHNQYSSWLKKNLFKQLLKNTWKQTAWPCCFFFLWCLILVAFLSVLG